MAANELPLFNVNDNFQEELSFRLNEVKGNLWPNPVVQ
jgi:hypothetical protein